MLTNLHVKNLALIDEAEVEFDPGLNILTGETGAGKSILIGSINAALGKKISREMIRTGETSALVELVFETENPHVLELLKEMDLEAEEGQVIISRKITGSRSVCRINGEACNISQVKALASLLLDIHGQHEHQSLLYPDRQIAILDAFAGTEAATAKGEVRALYQEWKNVRKELSAYELDEEARKREAAFLTFEINEIDQAELKEGEDEALETAYRKMGHAKKIAESLQTVYAITGYGAENSAGEQVGRAIRELQQSGAEFVICSGRAYSGAHPIVSGAGIHCSYICLSGAMICTEDGKACTSSPYPRKSGGYRPDSDRRRNLHGHHDLQRGLLHLPPRGTASANLPVL